MSLPKEIFQVSATAIPTLVIAISISGKFGERSGHNVRQEKRAAGMGMTGTVLGFALAVLAAEVSSLVAVAADGGGIWQGILSLAAISILMYLVTMVLLEDTFAVYGDRAGKVLHHCHILLTASIFSCGSLALILIGK